MLLPPINITHVIAYVQYGVCSCQKADILPVVSSMRYFYVRLMLLPLIDVADVIGLCSLCLMLLPCSRCYATRLTLLQLQFRDVIQNPIPYVKHMVLADISIKGWIVHPDVNSFLMALVTF